VGAGPFVRPVGVVDGRGYLRCIDCHDPTYHGLDSGPVYAGGTYAADPCDSCGKPLHHTCKHPRIGFNGYCPDCGANPEKKNT
jgi:hypothetical protein